MRSVDFSIHFLEKRRGHKLPQFQRYEEGTMLIPATVPWVAADDNWLILSIKLGFFFFEIIDNGLLLEPVTDLASSGEELLMCIVSTE